MSDLLEAPTSTDEVVTLPTIVATAPDVVPTPLDEVALRRPAPDFLGGTPVRLSDGGLWFLPRPALELSPMFTDGDEMSVGVTTTLGPAFDSLVLALDQAPEDDETKQGFHYVHRMMQLACWMVRRNYSISNADLSRLLKLRTQDESNQYMWQQITGVARGTLGEERGQDIADSPQ